MVKCKILSKSWFSFFCNDKKRDTLAVLASTVFFKANWQQKFQVLTEAQSEARNLCYSNSVENLLNGQCSPVTWMTKTEYVTYRRFTSGVNAQVFEMPLRNAKSAVGDITNKVNFTQIPYIIVTP